MNRGSRRLLWGWVRGFKGGLGSNGCFTVPRDLALDADGTLHQELAPELKKLRGARVQQKNVRLTDTAMPVPGAQGNTLELEVEIEPGSAKSAGLTFRHAQGHGRELRIAFDGKQLDLAGAKVPFTLKPGERRLRLRVLLDRSVVEVFVNGRECVTRVVEAVDADAQVELFAAGGSATIPSFKAWPIRSIW
jgi:beta-fructofuranosidase